MSRYRSVLAAAVMVVAGACLVPATHAAAATGASACRPGAVVTEVLRAPHTVASGQSFSVHINLRNCTSSTQGVTQEGRLTPPAPCTAPVIDPLPLSLQPHQRLSTGYTLQAPPCQGTYAVEVTIAQGSAVLAQRTVDIAIS